MSDTNRSSNGEQDELSRMREPFSWFDALTGLPDAACLLVFIECLFLPPPILTSGRWLTVARVSVISQAKKRWSLRRWWCKTRRGRRAAGHDMGRLGEANQQTADT
ncbi:uncharacterized protein TrAFT101_012056 [Trichoderma asperellum]|uniref:uncharacterized protein n=1 Tax=Trichoderma asperellum TaxID=101201 RepID=UPI0033290E8F|nr:hypothetical protein TrAFT101_012056 [Trichoderma asperellum]